MPAAHHRVELLRCRSPGIEAVAADTTLAFGRHTHEQFGIGLMERGAQKSASGRGGVEASAGDLITVNPGEVHDGAPIGHGGRAWRMLYLDPAVLAHATGDIAQEAPVPAAEFTRPALHDPVLASAFRRLFQTLTVADGHLDGLATDEALLRVLARLLQRRPAGAARQGPTPPGIARARARMDDEPAAPASLASLAGEAGLSRYQFLRAFARATGLTPHAYLMQRRIHQARRLIASGTPLAEAATGSGFCDQSHMNRLFMRSFGMAPGRYAAAVKG